MRFKIIYFVFVLILCFSCSETHSDLIPLQQKLQIAIEDTLKKRLYKDVNMGILISTVDDKFCLYQKNIKETFIPASAFKIIPSAIALIKFRPEYQFKTPLFYTGEIIAGKLVGDLYIKGQGDPSLKTEDLKKAVEFLKEKGITQIKGDLLYDISYLDEERNRYAPNARNLYAPPCGLCLNYNWIDVRIKNGPPPQLSLYPKTSYAQLDYNVTIEKTAKPGRPDLSYRLFPWGDKFSINGKITGWDKKYHYVWLGVSRPGLFCATTFKELCVKKGVRISGDIKKGIVPGDAKELYQMVSVPMRDIVKVMNQESNNVIAEMLNKDLGAEFESKPGTRAKGINVVTEFCENNIGLEKNSFSIGDASGLSIKNKFSAEQFIKVLNYLYRDEKVREAFIPTLARQGHHPHAMIPVPPDHIQLFVKTGTLSVRGVNSVVGYIHHLPKKKWFSFAILMNRKEIGPITFSGTLTNPLLKKIVDTIK